jgi:hypothetical protein
LKFKGERIFYIKKESHELAMVWSYARFFLGDFDITFLKTTGRPRILVSRTYQTSFFFLQTSRPGYYLQQCFLFLEFSGPFWHKLDRNIGTWSHGSQSAEIVCKNIIIKPILSNFCEILFRLYRGVLYLIFNEWWTKIIFKRVFLEKFKRFINFSI